VERRVFVACVVYVAVELRRCVVDVEFEYVDSVGAVGAICFAVVDECDIVVGGERFVVEFVVFFDFRVRFGYKRRKCVYWDRVWVIELV